MSLYIIRVDVIRLTIFCERKGKEWGWRVLMERFYLRSRGCDGRSMYSMRLGLECMNERGNEIFGF